MDSFEKFIVENEAADTVRLVMARREWPVPEDPFLADIDAKTLVVNTIEARGNCGRSFRNGWRARWLVYPSSLCAEQCSSSDTARYKAAIVKRIFNEYVGSAASADSATENKMVTEPVEVTSGIRKTGRIADLTGGLGVGLVGVRRGGGGSALQ